MKSCSVCGELKELSEFSPDKRKPDGRASRCKACHRHKGRQWREANPDYLRAYYERNRDEQLAKQKAAREADPEKQRAKARRQYERHRDDYLRRSKEHRERNPESTRAVVVAWHAAHPERIRAFKRKSQAKRRVRKRKLPYEDVDPALVFNRDAGICGICGEPVAPDNWHLDHIVPLAAGGSHTYGNLQVAHPSCNLSKGARLDLAI